VQLDAVGGKVGAWLKKNRMQDGMIKPAKNPEPRTLTRREVTRRKRSLREKSQNRKSTTGNCNFAEKAPNRFWTSIKNATSSIA